MRHDENGVENGSRVGDEDLEMSAMEDDAVLLARVHGIGGLLVCSCGRELTVEWCPSLSVDQKANAQLRTEEICDQLPGLVFKSRVYFLPGVRKHLPFRHLT